MPPKFQTVSILDTNRTIVGLFDSGSEAAIAATALNATAKNVGSRLRYVVEKINDISDEARDQWQAREQERFDLHIYTQVPWRHESWWTTDTANKYRDHFAHVSTDQTGKLAYTPDDMFGVEDRQLVIGPGKYLTRFFSDFLSEPDIQRWTLEWSNEHDPHGVLFATTEDDIERVFRSIGSCMGDGIFNSNVHPARMYAAGDLSIAYLMNGRGSIGARCVVWQEKSLYTSAIYGDYARLENALIKAGFRDGSMVGARMQRVAQGDSFIMPYLDSGGYVDDMGDHFIISRGGELSASGTDGMLYEYQMCQECGGDYDPDDMWMMEDGYYCCDCIRDCDHCHNRVVYSSMEEVENEDGYDIRVCEHCVGDTVNCDTCSILVIHGVTGSDDIERCWNCHVENEDELEREAEEAAESEAGEEDDGVGDTPTPWGHVTVTDMARTGYQQRRDSQEK